MSTKRSIKNFNREAVIEELSDILEDSFRVHSLNIGIIGCGEVGKNIAYELSEVGRLEDGRGRVSKIYLFSTDPSKAFNLKDELLRNPNEVDDVEALHVSKLKMVAKSLDVSIICSGKRLVSKDGSAFRYKDLVANPEARGRFEENMEIVRNLAYTHRDGGFNGTAVVITNLPDLLAYHFAVSAEMNPLQVVGMNHLDTKRFRISALDAFSDSYKMNFGENCPVDITEVDGVVIGPHDENLFSPLASNLRLGKFAITRFSIYSNELKKGIEVDTREFVNRILKKMGGTTAPEVAKATADVVRAIANEEYVVGVSVYGDKDLHGKSIEPMYLGWPVKFRGFTAKKQGLKFPLWDEEAERYNSAYRLLLGLAKDFRINGDLRQPVEPFPLINNLLDAAGKDLLRQRIDKFVEGGFSRFFEREQVSLEEELDSLRSQYPVPFYRRRRGIEEGALFAMPAQFERTYFRSVNYSDEAKENDLLWIDFGVKGKEKEKFFSVKAIKGIGGKVSLEEATNDEYYARHKGDFEEWR